MKGAQYNQTLLYIKELLLLTNQGDLKVVDPICRSISLNVTILCKDEKYTIMMIYMESYSCRL